MYELSAFFLPIEDSFTLIPFSIASVRFIATNIPASLVLPANPCRIPPVVTCILSPVSILVTTGFFPLNSIPLWLLILFIAISTIDFLLISLIALALTTGIFIGGFFTNSS